MSNKRVLITNDLTPDVVLVGVQAYLGSFIQGPEFKREKNFWASRSVIEIKPEDMPDSFSKALLQVIEVAELEGISRTPEALTELMFTEGLAQVAKTDPMSIMLAMDKAEAMIRSIGKRGKTTLEDFRRTEITLHEMWRQYKMDRLPDMIKDINNTPGLTATDKLMRSRELVEKFLGGSSSPIKTYDWEAQMEVFDKLPGEHLAQVGKPMFSLPPHWGLNGFVPRLHPGDKVVLSGGTGEGKSAAAMQFAEWCAIVGKRVLVIHMEDSIDTILMRQTCRWIPDTAMEELERGDPLSKMEQMIALRKQWKENSGGELIYKYLAGNTIDIILGQMNEVARAAQMEGKPLDVVVFDYFQKVDFDSQITNSLNYVNVATNGAERLKIWAETWNAVVFVVSQETTDKHGDKHTAWTKALEHKPQLYISLTRPVVKATADEEYITLDGKKRRVAEVGQRSVYVHMQIKKSNRYSMGASWCILDGPRFRIVEPKFKQKIDAQPELEFEIPIQKPADEAFYKWQEQYLKMWDRVAYDVLNPDKRKRQADNKHT